MFKMPSNAFPSTFPKSFSNFRESFEQFVRTIESYIFKMKVSDDQKTKNQNIIQIIDQSCELSSKLSEFLKETQAFNDTGMDEITKNIDYSFQKIFKTNSSINQAIKQEKIVNQEMISKGLELYKSTYKAFKLTKEFFQQQYQFKKDEPQEASKPQFDISELKNALYLVNSDGFHLMTKKVPSSFSNKAELTEMRSSFCTNCGYISSLVEVASIFHESLNAIILNLSNLTKLFNDVICQCNIPARIELAITPSQQCFVL